MISLNKILQKVGLTPDLERRLNRMKKVYCLNESVHPVLSNSKFKSTEIFFKKIRQYDMANNCQDMKNTYQNLTS